MNDMELQASIAPSNAEHDERVRQATIRWSLGGDPTYLTVPSQRRYDEDVADRNLLQDSLKRIRTFQDGYNPAPRAILINSGCRRFGEDTADRNLGLPHPIYSTLDTMSEDDTGQAETSPSAESCVPMVESVYMSRSFPISPVARRQSMPVTNISQRSLFRRFESQRASLDTILSRRQTLEANVLKSDGISVTSADRYPASTAHALFSDEQWANTVGSSVLVNFPSDESLSSRRPSQALSKGSIQILDPTAGSIVHRRRTEKAFRRSAGLTSSEASSNAWINRDSSGESSMSVKGSPRAAPRRVYSFIPPQYMKARVEHASELQPDRSTNSDGSSHDSGVQADLKKDTPPIADTPARGSICSSNDHMNYFKHSPERMPRGMESGMPEFRASGTHPDQSPSTAENLSLEPGNQSRTGQ